MDTSYDRVAYPGHVLAQAHPDRLETLATLHGLAAVPSESCRVLELGCGDGVNALAIGYELPDALITGIDLAESGIERGRELAARAGVRNVSLSARDIMDIGTEFGQFDYIVAHGIYSWVPEPVRNRLIEICRANLAPNGVAYVSYNAYPGCHARDMLRAMMMYHVRELPEPTQRIEQARALAGFLAESVRTDAPPYQAMLKHLNERIKGFSDNHLFHDDLGECFHPVYFHQFAEHAGSQGLQYLCEAHFFEMNAGLFPDTVREVVKTAADSRIAQEQYFDFLKGRSFRQTLLVHAGRQLTADLKGRSLRGFHVASPLRAEPADANLVDRSVVRFTGPLGSSLRIDLPAVKLALAHLGAAWPQAVPFDSLVDVATADAGLDRATAENVLSDVLLGTYSGGMIELMRRPPRFVDKPTVRPRASALARAMAQDGVSVVTLRRHNIQMADEIARRLLCALDGTRDLAALVDAAYDPRNPPGGQTREAFAVHLERNIALLGEMALLEA